MLHPLNRFNLTNYNCNFSCIILNLNYVSFYSIMVDVKVFIDVHSTLMENAFSKIGPKLVAAN